MFKSSLGRISDLLLVTIFFISSVAFAQDATNKSNPLDYLGSMHNAALKTLAKSAPKTRQEATQLVDQYFLQIGYLNAGNMTMSSSVTYPRIQLRIYELAKSADVYSTAMKQGYSSIISSYLKKIISAGDLILAKNGFAAAIEVENQIIAEKALSENERVLLLGTAAISRHSAAYAVANAGGSSPARWPWITDALGGLGVGKDLVSTGNPWLVGGGMLVGGAAFSAISYWGL